MIEILIFFIHIIAAIFAFTKKWQESSIKEGFLAIILITLLFFIGWALTGTLAHALMPDKGENNLLTGDSLSLLILLPIEIWFYIVFILKSKQ